MATKHCPFCGSNEVTVDSGPSTQAQSYYSAAVKCRHCSAQGSVFMDENVEWAIIDAIEAWNDAKPTIWYEIKRVIRYRLSHYIPHNWIPF